MSRAAPRSAPSASRSDTAGVRWRFWVDRGGTFTDVVARAPSGELSTLKLLSEDAEHYVDPAVEGIRRLLVLRAGEPITPDRVECVRMGTTVATNALLERRGERTLLVTTRGFKDALRIASQARPRLFDLRIVLPELLYERVIEVDERMDAAGRVIVPLDAVQLGQALRAARADGICGCAIVFMHAYRAAMHELIAERLAKDAGFVQVSVSHRVSPLMKLVARGDTTVVDAYLSPVLRRYVERVAAEMPGVRLLFMQSSGGLAEAGYFQGKDAILSGPAGGIVGMVSSARAAGHTRLIGFDMGGTSTDVSHHAGDYERSFDTEVAGVRVRAPMMSIHTIAAGGGSIIRFDGARLRVGPESAGAMPGPMSYRRGGPLTVTDANLMLGRLQTRFFPRVFGPGADQGLDDRVVSMAFEQLARRLSGAGEGPITPERLAAGAIRIAVGSMANAIKKISVARGYDVTRYTLQCFGGAAGQHACLVADALGMQRVFCHPLAGVLSALGMGLARQISIRQATLEQPLEGLEQARALASRLELEACEELERQGVSAGRVRARARLHVRYRGTDTALSCELPPATMPDAVAALQAEFDAGYRRRFGFLLPQLDLVIESVSVECIGADDDLDENERLGAEGVSSAQRGDPDAPPVDVRMYCFSDQEGEGWRAAHLYDWAGIAPGSTIAGPAIVTNRNSTIVVEPGWRASKTERGNLELERTRPRAAAIAAETRADPVMLEIFNNLFMNIAEQMGLRLANSAQSVNIKERLDFSCALFDATGALIANAPHMPVHLGSMSESIRTVIARNPDLAPGDVFALNDPYRGGTHLPDVTVITPVFEAGAREPRFFVASRGHHADIGGLTPGSMPPFSTSIGEEGVLLDNLKLVEKGVLREAQIRALLAQADYPARNPEQNLADLRAQIAANEKGAQELARMTEQFGTQTVASYMRHVQDNAEECVRRVITALGEGEFKLPLDSGAEIRVKVSVDRAKRAAIVDFTGTSSQRADNFNAPRAITVAAVLYVFRTLVGDEIPLNAGCLAPLEIIVPEGCLLNPRPPAAVVAGNVETSMCVTNALYGALGIMAASQCTMNNFTFGNARHQYYETIAGGSGAGPGFEGTSVVQTHMTNSRLTDPEVLEFRYPVRLESYAIRPRSGGAGRWRGGDGGVRRVRFLEAMSAAILSNGRVHGAFGMAGGEAGAPGENHVERVDGTRERLMGIGEVEMRAGDIFEIATPGGGGYGHAECARVGCASAQPD